MFPSANQVAYSRWTLEDNICLGMDLPQADCPRTLCINCAGCDGSFKQLVKVICSTATQQVPGSLPSGVALRRISASTSSAGAETVGALVRSGVKACCLIEQPLCSGPSLKCVHLPGASSHGQACPAAGCLKMPGISGWLIC